VDRGDLGEIQLMRGSFIFDHSALPAYWRDVPPMHYATHAVGPLLALTRTHPVSVRCLGSGSLGTNGHARFGHGHPVEIALFRLAGSPAALEVTQAMFDFAREPIESFSVFGSAMSFEWAQREGELPVVHRLTADRPWASASREEVPDYADRVPATLRHHTYSAVAFEVDGVEHEAVGPHGGSHPHLVHEFVSSIIDRRPSFPDAVVSAQWTAAGICAHESALRNGDEVEIPTFG
jgi:predicted dehydrogenase